jgi:hypothetical protein
MRDLNGQLVEYGYHVKSVQVDSELARDPESYPVTVVTERAGKEEMFKAKYVLVRLVSFSLAHFLITYRAVTALIVL